MPHFTRAMQVADAATAQGGVVWVFANLIWKIWIVPATITLLDPSRGSAAGTKI
jgi:hypothetical protein